MKIEPGYWYIETDFEPFYEIVYVGGGHVWSFNADDCDPVEDYDPNDFIKPVPVPFGDY